MTTRRGFLGAMLAACAAPAIVRADSLMRVIPRETEILLPPEPAENLATTLAENLAKSIEHTATVVTASALLKVGDVFSIQDMPGGKLFRVTAVETSKVMLALHEPAIARLPSRVSVAPWFRQHEKRGRR